jgi:glycosyltransferase involved in cell wall biosynthesis
MGGQGLNLQHMIAAYAPASRLETYCRKGGGEGASHTVPDPRSIALAMRVPLLNRRSDWWTLASDVQFDDHVASKLEHADVFQGSVGQAAISLRRARQLGMATVLDVVNTHVDDFATNVKRECRKFGVTPFIHPAMQWRIRREYERADLIRVMSEVARRTFLERGFAPQRVFVATPPCDLASSPIAKHDEETFRVGFVGLVAPWKGFHYLVEAFDQVNLPRSELVLWGGTGSRGVSQWLRRKIARNKSIVCRPAEVRSVGFADVYGRMSVLVHPSLSDGFAYVVAEAMACGVPVIVTSKTGASDLVVDGKNGFVVPPGDAGAIAERLRFMAEDRERVRRMGMAARDAVAGLTLERFRAQLLEPVLSLAGGASGAR